MFYQILDKDFKIRLTSDHRVKFHADQPTELKDLALKRKIKNICGKT